MPQSRRALCAAYAVIALAALIATWSQNLAYFTLPAELIQALGAFLLDTRANPASRSLGADIAFVLLAASVLMVLEARKHGIKYVWAYIFGGIFVAISVTFPLFLLARELRQSEAAHLKRIDAISLTALAIFVSGLTLWILRQI